MAPRPLVTALMARVLLALASAATPAAAQQNGVAAPCTLDGGEDRTVTRVVDGETLILDGGTELRLIGALAPSAFDAAGEAMDWPLASQARVTLERLVGGRSVRVAFAGRRADRYGRVLAHVFGGSESARVWVQGEMLRRGLARAYALEGNTQCLAELVSHEAVARETATGMWAEAAYAVRSADDTTALSRLAGTFQIVEGRVLGVSDVRGVTYVNFGEDFRQDFTVAIRAPARRGAKPQQQQQQQSQQLSHPLSGPGGAHDLKGRTVRVRGWIERRGGPLIEVAHPAAIEVLEVQPEVQESDPNRGAVEGVPGRRRARSRRTPEPQ